MFLYLDLHHPVTKNQEKERNTADPAPRQTRKTGERKRNKVTRRKAKNTKRSMGNITKRKREKENTSRHPLLHQLVNHQKVTEPPIRSLKMSDVNEADHVYCVL